MRKRGVLVGVVALLLGFKRSLVLRLALQVIFKVRLALLRWGVWPVEAKELFLHVDDEQGPSKELLALCHIMQVAKFKESWTAKETLFAMKLFFGLGFLRDWRATPAHTVETFLAGESGVPCHIVRSEMRDVRSDAVIMYLHGGGYVAGTFDAYKPLAVRLSERCKCSVIFVDYTLVPIKKLEDVQEEIVQAYCHLVGDMGIDSSKVVVVGDSAGGGHTLGLLQKIAARDLPKPKAAAMSSPYCDLSHTSDSFHQNNKDCLFLQKHMLEGMRVTVLEKSGRISDPCHPDVSFAFGTYQDLPPLFLSVGRGERLFDDCMTIQQRAEAASVSVDLDVQPHGIHCFPIANFNVPEFRAGFDRLAAFIESHLFNALTSI